MGDGVFSPEMVERQLQTMPHDFQGPRGDQMLTAHEKYNLEIYPKGILLCISILIALILLVFNIGVFVGEAHAEVDTTKAVLHHTASPDWSVERIRKIHVEENGWDDVGYHKLIRKNGDVEDGRPLNIKGAHAKGRNNYVGIALTGYSKFTDLQITSLKKLLIELGVKKVERHHEECPGQGLNVEEIQVWLNTNNVLAGLK